MTTNEIQQVRERIAKRIFHEIHPITDVFPDYWGITGTMDDESWRRLERHCFYSADQILSDPDILVKDPDQSLPCLDSEFDNINTKSPDYRNAIDDMIQAHWVKVIKEEG